MNRKLLALTVLQPFATGIVLWGKPVENRGWLPGSRLPVGSWLAIHAGARDYPDANSPEFREWLAFVSGLDLPESLASVRVRPEDGGRDSRFRTVADGYLSGLPHSAIVGVGRVGGFDDRPAGWSPWAHPEEHHWRFDAVVPFGKPLPCKGAQGLWTVPDDVASACRLSFALDRANIRSYP